MRSPFCFIEVTLLTLVNKATAESIPLKSVKLVENTWTASALNVRIAELIIEQEIHDVAVDIDVINGFPATFTALAGNNADAVWPSSINDLQLGLIADGSVVRLGQLGVRGEIGWFVPDYVIEDYPEAKSWEFYTLNSTAEIFATSETAPLGRFLGVDPSYSSLDDQIIENLGMPFQQVHAGNESNALEILKNAVDAREPILMYWWAPEAAIGEYNLVKVNLPQVIQRCLASINNQDGLYECDYPVDIVEKFAANGLEAKSPEVFEFLEAFVMTNEIQVELLQRVEFGGENIDSVAADWVAKNEEIWRAWLVRDGESNTSVATAKTVSCLIAVLSVSMFTMFSL